MSVPVILCRNKMKNIEYESVEHIDSDLTLMFENAKRYNVPHSPIYKRALKLQHIQQAREAGSGRRLCDLFMVKPSKKDYPDYYKVILDPMDLRTIDYNIRSDKYMTEDAMVGDMKLMFRNARHYNEEGSQNYTDKRGRRLSTIFLRLPSRAELPDYYIAIKKPVDMEKIKSHMLANKYQDVDALVEDLVLMFNNACTYNEPESLIYRDALLLHKVLLETRRELEGGEDNHVPDVPRLIQELIRSLFVSVLGHQDDEGRCYSDSLAEIPAADPVNPEKPSLNFEIIRKNVERGRYKRLDVFQDHMFEVLEKARRLNRSEAEKREDTVGGSWQVQRTYSQDCSFKDSMYHVGDYVYVEPAEPNLQPHIIYIERLWEDDTGQRMSTSASLATLPSQSPSKRSRCGPCPSVRFDLFPEMYLCL
ncbi:hypothetical protein XENOCAPTIV_003947 [Xenoophorus captivus]|uniref:Uncharacterized protein n=1 Tax=Xenoophorus captivus TaxID=1517983 RepID=A0ABV0QPS6_9TELE